MTDQTEIARELKAIRETLAFSLGWMLGCLIVIAIAVGGWVLHDAASQQQPPPPEIQQHDLDLPHTPVDAVASRGERET